MTQKLLVIDPKKTYTKQLTTALRKLENVEIVSSTQLAEISHWMETERFAAIFIRLELYDYRLFECFGDNVVIPALVLTGKFSETLGKNCGLGNPWFLTDNYTQEDVKQLWKRINSGFISLVNYKFIIAQVKGQPCKVDIDVIQKLQWTGHSTMIYTPCGIYQVEKPLEELVKALPLQLFRYESQDCIVRCLPEEMMRN